jgi:hypothetical protein
LLTAGKQTALVSDNGFVALWLCDDEIVRIGGLRGGENFLCCGVEPAELNVLEDGVVKQKCVLSYEPNLLAL